MISDVPWLAADINRALDKIVYTERKPVRRRRSSASAADAIRKAVLLHSLGQAMHYDAHDDHAADLCPLLTAELDALVPK